MGVYEQLSDKSVDPNKREFLLKSLSATERATLKKVLQFISGETIKRPTHEELEPLKAKLMQLKATKLEAEPSPFLTKVQKGFENRFKERVSTKALETTFQAAQKRVLGEQHLEAGRIYLNIYKDIRSDKDKMEARSQFEKAVEKGNMRAHLYLAELEGTSDHLKVGAKGGDPHCQHELAKQLIDAGKSKEAEKWLLKLAKPGSTLESSALKELCNLGHFYEDRKDLRRALKMYEAGGDKVSSERVAKEILDVEVGLPLKKTETRKTEATQVKKPVAEAEKRNAKVDQLVKEGNIEEASDMLEKSVRNKGSKQKRVTFGEVTDIPPKRTPPKPLPHPPISTPKLLKLVADAGNGDKAAQAENFRLGKAAEKKGDFFKAAMHYKLAAEKGEDKCIEMLGQVRRANPRLNDALDQLFAQDVKDFAQAIKNKK